MVKAYSVFDVKAANYAAPFFTFNDQTAIRILTDAVADPSTVICQHPEDYSLYWVGTFDEDTGIFAPVEHPHVVCTAASVVRIAAPVRKLVDEALKGKSVEVVS